MTKGDVFVSRLRRNTFGHIKFLASCIESECCETEDKDTARIADVIELRCQDIQHCIEILDMIDEYEKGTMKLKEDKDE